MKKPQRSFVIEYKSGRRKADSGALTSIWGDLDLKSVARDVETALPAQISDATSMNASELMQRQEDVVETPAGTMEHRVSVSHDIGVVDPSDRSDPVPTDASGAADMDEASRLVADATPALPAATELKRRRKQQATVSKARVPRVNRPLPDLARPAAPVNDVDEDDLLQLEEENRLLKTLLTAKLRQENSWLRERLQRL